MFHFQQHTHHASEDLQICESVLQKDFAWPQGEASMHEEWSLRDHGQSFQVPKEALCELGEHDRQRLAGEIGSYEQAVGA